MLMLTLDIGSTCLKAQVFDEKGNILFYRAAECALAEFDGTQTADIDAITETVILLTREAAKVGEICSVAISSFGESFVALDENDSILYAPMLYTDKRGEREAEILSEMFGKDKLFSVTGTLPAAMYSISKLLWLKNNRSEIFRRTKKIMLICDYIGYLLTGKRAIDYGLATRTGCFDIRNKVFSQEILNNLEMDASLFSEPMPTGSIIGEVTPEAEKRFGLTAGCKLILGSHDQICATIGAGAISDGEAADGMGSVECITAVFDGAPDDLQFAEMGYCVVPFPGGQYCTYMFNYTSNLLVNWYRRQILHGFCAGGDDQFAYLEGDRIPPDDLLLLPYFAGSATPHCDMSAKGAILNLTLGTTDKQIFRAILEGTSYEMKLNLKTAAQFGIRVREIIATGGGANSDFWLQIKSDILRIPVMTLRSAEGGLCGLAMLSAVALGVCDDLVLARDIYVRYREKFRPQKTHREIYEKKYAKYKKLYRALKEFWK